MGNNPNLALIHELPECSSRIIFAVTYEIEYLLVKIIKD